MTSLDSFKALLARHGQQHLLAYWDELDEPQRRLLLDDLALVDFGQCAQLARACVLREPELDLPDCIDPPQSYPATPGDDQLELYDRARVTGERAVAEGKVAAFTVAGGQGTRLGFDGPKGIFCATPVRGASLFQVFAEYLHGLHRKYGELPPWYIMTSPSNHSETLSFFESNGFFGLPDERVTFFAQGQMPVFLADGRIALSRKHRVALAPDGHGGALTAMRRSGALDQMREQGIEQISYFQVDNPLVKVIDPLFIGLHIETGSQMSSKAVAKAHALEKVGNFCCVGRSLQVIEYSDLPPELATRLKPDGSPCFDAGSIAIHVLDRAFVETLTEPNAAVELPWHHAHKKAEILDDHGDLVRPGEPNAVKLERFVFDAIPLAKNPLCLFTRREEEFSPVKNAEGADSPATSRRDQSRRAARWLKQAGIEVPTNGGGEPLMPLEISPAAALDAEDLADQLQSPGEQPIIPGLCLAPVPR